MVYFLGKMLSICNIDGERLLLVAKFFNFITMKLNNTIPLSSGFFVLLYVSFLEGFFCSGRRSRKRIQM
ncbi:hypothetical protein HanPI659440_Chr17g0686831 [Helianthus annuus]|nr:hypothetical protein HanPI659440_Chr17g0686831 [Helianthus annuus]